MTQPTSPIFGYDDLGPILPTLPVPLFRTPSDVETGVDPIALPFSARNKDAGAIMTPAMLVRASRRHIGLKRCPTWIWLVWIEFFLRKYKYLPGAACCYYHEHRETQP